MATLRARPRRLGRQLGLGEEGRRRSSRRPATASTLSTCRAAAPIRPRPRDDDGRATCARSPTASRPPASRSCSSATSMGGHARSPAPRSRSGPDRDLVYLTAFLPNDGQTLAQLAEGNRTARPARTSSSTRRPACPVREEVRGAFYGECTEEDAASAPSSRRVPESLAAIGAAVHVTEERAGSVPRVTSSAPATARSRSPSSGGCGRPGRARRC